MGPTTTAVAPAPSAEVAPAAERGFTGRFGFDWVGGDVKRIAPTARLDGVDLRPGGPLVGLDFGLRVDLGRWEKEGMYIPLLGAYMQLNFASDVTRSLPDGRTLEAGSHLFAGGRFSLPGIGERFRAGADWLELALVPSVSVSGFGVTEISAGSGTFHDVHTTQNLSASAVSASVDMRLSWCSPFTGRMKGLSPCLRVEPILVEIPTYGPVVPLAGVRAFFTYDMM